MKEDFKFINAAIDRINAGGIERFLKDNAEFSYSEIDGVYHYRSNLSSFDKFIFFDFKKTSKLSLVIVDKRLTFTDIINIFQIKDLHYNFRDDFSKISFNDNVYTVIDGKVDISVSPIKSTDDKGNVKYENEIIVRALILEYPK